MKNKEILILSTFFNKDLINNFYKFNKSLQYNTYEEQINFIKNKNYFSRIDLNSFFLKNYNSFEIFLGANFALRKLFKEENIKFNQIDEGVLKLIEIWKPKIIIFRDIGSFSIRKINQIKNINKLNFKTILLNGFPIRDINDYSLFDIVVFRNPWLLNEYKNKCKESLLIYHSFNTNILKNIKLKKFEEKKNLISFDGSSFSDGFYEHKKRYFYLYKLIERNLLRPNLYENNNFFHKLTFYLYIISKNSTQLQKGLIFILKALSVTNKKIFNKFYMRFDKIIDTISNFNSTDFNKFYRGPLSMNFKNQIKKANFGFDYYESMNNSKISINIHTESMGNTAANLRLFEITGIKSCMITEDFMNLSDLFSKDKEVVTYKNYDDLVEKIKYLKNNPNIAEEISENGHKKLLNTHTDKIRINEYFEMLKKI